LGANGKTGMESADCEKVMVGIKKMTSLKNVFIAAKILRKTEITLTL